MQLLRDHDELQQASRGGTSMCIGVFDGVHRGHQSLIHHAVECARQDGLSALAVTFEQHPLRLLAPPYAPQMLTTPEEKIELLAETGLDLCLLQCFTPAFMETPAERFLDDFLLQRCQARYVTCGPDFHFGNRGVGDVAMLTRFAQLYGIQVHVVEALLDGRMPVRSTRIRQSIREGHLEEAMRLLGRPYHLTGKVVTGDRRGRKIGYPTANIEPPADKLAPGDGVYAVRVAIVPGAGESGAVPQLHSAMLNIGIRPTFGGELRTIEAHLFDFDGDLYDRIVRVTFIARVRDEKNFNSVDELLEQLRLDESACRALLEPR